MCPPATTIYSGERLLSSAKQRRGPLRPLQSNITSGARRIVRFCDQSKTGLFMPPGPMRLNLGHPARMHCSRAAAPLPPVSATSRLHRPPCDVEPLQGSLDFVGSVTQGGAAAPLTLGYVLLPFQGMPPTTFFFTVWTIRRFRVSVFQCLTHPASPATRRSWRRSPCPARRRAGRRRV